MKSKLSVGTSNGISEQMINEVMVKGCKTTGFTEDKYKFNWTPHLHRGGWLSKLLRLCSSLRHPHMGAEKLQGHLAGNWWGKGAFVTHSHPLGSESPFQSGQSKTLFYPWVYKLILRSGFTFNFLTASFTTSVPFGASTSVFPRNWKEKQKGSVFMMAYSFITKSRFFKSMHLLHNKMRK